MSGTGEARERADRSLFDTIGETYAAKDLVVSARVARRHRLQQTVRSIALGPRSAILEIGCGAGFAATYLKGCYQRYLGVDHSEVLIEHARRLNSRPGAEFVACSWRDLPSAESFELVVMIGVLHHLSDPVAALTRLAERVVPGGWVVANEPHPGNPFVSLARRLRSRFDRAYSDDQDQLPRARLVTMFEQAGLRRISVRPQGVFSPPFAEVPLRPTWLFAPLAGLACLGDRFLERWCLALLGRVSWNLVVSGQRPDGPTR